jgi:phage terminase large subunit-like protein
VENQIEVPVGELRNPFREAFIIVGRRGGKSFISALIAVFLACFKDWREVLGPGEKGFIMCLACDKLQARVIFNYVREILQIPILKSYVINETREEIELKGGLIIAVHTSSYRSLRGYTILAAICDELAFWRSDFSANPAGETLIALRPSLGNVPDSLLLGISTGYSRTGPLYEAFRDKYGQDNKEVLDQEYLHFSFLPFDFLVFGINLSEISYLTPTSPDNLTLSVNISRCFPSNSRARIFEYVLNFTLS